MPQRQRQRQQDEAGQGPNVASAICPLTTLTAKICCDAQHAPLPNVIALAAPEPRQDGKLMRQREFIALFGSTALAKPRIQAFVGNLTRRKHRRSLSPEFQHAFALEVLKTERLRIIALIVVATALAVGLGTFDLLAPAALGRIWHGRFPVLLMAAGIILFVLFEASILLLIARQIKRGGDVPQLRRYIGAFVETSLPSIVIATHMSNMGAAQALAFVGPLLYFVFIILSTLRLDFWLPAFTGFVAGAELLGLAFLHPAAQTAASDPTLAAPFVMSRSAVIFACGVIAGAVGTQLCRQFEASIAAATARDHVTNLFGQHVSPQVVERLLAADPTAATATP